MGYTDNKVLRSDEGIKLGLSYGKVFGTILGDIGGITLGLDVGTDLVSLDGSFDGYNYRKLEAIFLWALMGSTGGKVLGSNKIIKLGFSGFKFIGAVL